ILKIWKNEPRFVKNEFKNTISESKFNLTYGSLKPLGEYWTIHFNKVNKIVSMTMTTPQNCNNKDGVFILTEYQFPFARQLDETHTEFLFHASTTSQIIFYPLTKSSCYMLGKVDKIDMIEH